MSEHHFDTPDAAEAAFYAAFEAADGDAMMRVWADDEHGLECVHPMSPRLAERDAIEASWRAIFASGPGMRFTINDVRRLQAPGGEIAVHVVHEDIRHGPGHAQRSRIIATNVYRRTDKGWRMVLHHGSPGSDPADQPATPPGTLH